MPVFTPFASQFQDWRPVRGAKLDIRTSSFNLWIRAESVDSEATGQIIGLDTSTVV